jgi:chromate reductase
VVAISGSLRKDALNTQLLQRAQELAPANMRIEIFTSLSDIPHFNEDLEAFAPDAVQHLRDEVLRADGLLIATPEYNASVPGALKNAIDWLSRAGVDRHHPLVRKPAAIMGVSQGPFGSIRAQLALRQILQKTGASVVATPEVAVPFGHQQLAEDREPDKATTALLAQLLTELSHLIERHHVPAP